MSCHRRWRPLLNLQLFSWQIWWVSVQRHRERLMRSTRASRDSNPMLLFRAHRYLRTLAWGRTPRCHQELANTEETQRRDKWLLLRNIKLDWWKEIIKRRAIQVPCLTVQWIIWRWTRVRIEAQVESWCCKKTCPSHSYMTTSSVRTYRKCSS